MGSIPGARNVESMFLKSDDTFYFILLKTICPSPTDHGYHKKVQFASISVFVSGVQFESISVFVSGVVYPGVENRGRNLAKN